MFTQARKLMAAALIAALTGAMALGGCQTIERETGLNRSTQAGAAGGAAFGGIIAALANANPAWIAASVILGGVTGGALGKYLGEKDARQYAESHYRALDNLKAGQTSSWRDPSTGNHGSTTVHRSFTAADGALCKNFTESVHTSAKDVKETATACKAANGDWKLRAA
jgi:surface antigen